LAREANLLGDDGPVGRTAWSKPIRMAFAHSIRICRIADPP